MKAALALLAVLVFSTGYLINESYAEILPKNAYLLEGSGFAVTEEIIRISEIDLGLSSQQKSGSTINFVTDDGFVTLDDEEFIISELKGKFLREGKYIRINGNVESNSGLDTSISFFGRLVDESKDASVYGFTGRITTTDDTYKIIYTTKLSSLTKIETTTTKSQENNKFSLSILKGASTKGLASNYIDGGYIRDQASQGLTDPLRLRYFSHDRISVEPGTSITITNNDSVPHSILSGKENYGDRYNPFTPDNRISTEVIQPGASVSIKFEQAGFYRLYDPDYPWMKIVAYVFPASDNLIFGQGKNLGN